MKNYAVLLVVFALLAVTACRGREAHPVAIHEPGDEQKSCAALMTEMTLIEGRVSKLGGEDKDKNTSNALWGVSGIFLYVPLLMLDLSDAEKTEMLAYQDRYRTLAVIAVNKGCDHKRSEAFAGQGQAASAPTTAAPVYAPAPAAPAPAQTMVYSNPTPSQRHVLPPPQTLRAPATATRTALPPIEPLPEAPSAQEPVYLIQEPAAAYQPATR